jgi:hypothetical protein
MTDTYIYLGGSPVATSTAGARVGEKPIHTIKVQMAGVAAVSSGEDKDVDGNSVPTYKTHKYTYDDSGNLKTDTVTDGTTSWLRTYTYQDGQLVADSGWVKQ